MKSPLKNQTMVLKKEKILKQYKGGSGYYMVMLLKDNQYKTKTVHRLVAETFIENTKNLPKVNHIDMNRENNIVTNLEWCTQQYNIQQAYKLRKEQGK